MEGGEGRGGLGLASPQLKTLNHYCRWSGTALRISYHPTHQCNHIHQHAQPLTCKFRAQGFGNLCLPCLVGISTLTVAEHVFVSSTNIMGPLFASIIMTPHHVV